jgi:hypothetical protein
MMAFPARPSIKNAGFAYAGMAEWKAKMRVASRALNPAGLVRPPHSAPAGFVVDLAERGPCSRKEAYG